ncbi:hypothetical protein [Variovorax sp. V512]|uniref:hypothetical protein n=1 Tax=Variovorax sp. V512 TaxID=3064160 RepID=UPI0034E8DE1D
MKVFLDSFNEMPREYWESGAYEADFSEFTSNIESSSLIIGSRTSDGLDKFGFPVYCLDQIDEAVVAEEIQKMNIAIEGRFDREILFLLQKPFYFQLAKSGAVSFKKDAHPRDFYQALLENLHRNFKERFAREFDLEKALSLAAYDAINRGEEAYPLADLLSALKSGLEAAGILDIDARDVANWLVSTSTLIPYIGGRVAFAHQSITEYLAATELARRYQSSPQIFKEKIALTRWDQALFLALSILPKTHADAFFHDIANADFELALAAVKYVEVGRDEIVSNLLSLIPEHLTKFGPFDNRIGWIVESNLPISEAHEPKLRALMKAGGMIGAAAVKRLFELKGAIVKDELLLEMLNARSDYNYCCNGIVSVLQPLVTAADIPAIVALVDSIAHEITLDSGDDVAHGFTSGVAMLLVDLEISAIKKCFLMNSESNHVPEIYARILCRMLWRVHSTQALELAGELLLRGVKKAATSIYFVANFAEEKNELSWDYFKREHVDHLIAIAEVPEEDAWSLKALRCICLGRPDLAQIVRDRASGRFGVVRAALLFCASPGSEEQVFEALNELVNMNQEQRMQQPTHFLEQIEVDWAGRETLFVQVLKIRDTKLALTVLDQVYGEKGAPLGFLDIGPIEWWLEWLAGECNSNLKHILLERISWLFSIYLSQDVRHSFVVEFNKDDSIYRSLLARSILIYQNHLTSDDFSSDAISFLLRGLECERGFDFRGHLLGRTATEKFVIDRLLPLIRDAQDPLKGNIEELVRQAGSRHGKRYLLN